MIRKLLSSVALITMFGLAPLAAQGHFGVVAGVVSSNLTVSSSGASLSFKSRTGFAAGVSMVHAISKDLEFAPELLYVQKGSKFTDGSETASLKVSYAELPLLFRAKFGTAATRPFVMAGPAIGVKASCKVSGSSGSTSVSSDCDDLDVNVKSTDVGLMFGGGVAAKRFSVSVRYDLGLTNVAKDPDPGTKVKNKALLAMVGISL
ncbi:MAG: porin family protein [Gemmatimonadales bacterium]